MIPTKIFALLWAVLFSLSLFTTVIIALTCADSSDAYPMIRTRTGTFGKIRHSRHHNKEFVNSAIGDGTSFPSVCPVGKVMGHNNRCMPVWP